MSSTDAESGRVSCVDDVLITDELTRRPARGPDYEAESRALSSLAEEIAANPDGGLQKVVETVLELCRADSAGVSILEPGEESGALRWRAVAGALAGSLSGTVPRTASPSGTVMERNAVLLFDRADRYFPALRDAEPRIYEHLLAPWHADGRPVGTLWAIGHTPEHRFDAEDGRLLQSLARFAAAVYQTVTARHEAEAAQHELERRVEERTQALRASDDLFRRTLEIETVGVLFFNFDGRITDANDAFLKMGGYTREDLKAGRLRWDELTPPEWVEATERVLAELHATGSTAPYEKEYFRKDRSRWYGLFAPRVIREGAGVEFVIDITERRRIEAERERLLVEAERARREAEDALRTRDEFLSVASHELRNPVAGIKATAQQLSRARSSGRLDDARTERYVRTILETSQRLGVLVNDLLDVSRLQSGKFPLHPEPTDLALLLRDAMAAQPHAARRLIRLEVEGDTAADVDRERIMQVMTNLLENAVKYSLQRGEVRVLLSRDDAGIRLQVRDTGIGLPAGYTEHVFQPFGRAANAAASNIPGMGLGLYICRRIAEAHGGKLWAESEGEGRGARFILSLPARRISEVDEQTPRAGDR